MNHISAATLHTALSYSAYRALTDSLLAEGKTTGDNHSPAMLEYTRMNVQRMHRLDKTTTLLPEVAAALQHLPQAQIWLTLTEAWCGDAAQVIPVLEKMAQATPLAELKLILRDQHPAIMDAFLTHGGRAIPKVIVLDARSGQVLGSWGPRPLEAQEIILQAKKDMENATPEDRTARFDLAKVDLQKWYAHNKTVAIQEEFLAAVRSPAAKALV